MVEPEPTGPAWADPWGRPVEHLQHLLDFARGSLLPQGFGRLDDRGGLATDTAEVLITARMASGSPGSKSKTA